MQVCNFAQEHGLSTSELGRLALLYFMQHPLFSVQLSRLDIARAALDAATAGEDVVQDIEVEPAVVQAPQEYGVGWTG